MKMSLAGWLFLMVAVLWIDCGGGRRCGKLCKVKHINKVLKRQIDYLGQQLLACLNKVLVKPGDPLVLGEDMPKSLFKRPRGYLTQVFLKGQLISLIHDMKLDMKMCENLLDLEHKNGTDGTMNTAPLEIVKEKSTEDDLYADDTTDEINTYLIDDEEEKNGSHKDKTRNKSGINHKHHDIEDNRKDRESEEGAHDDGDDSDDDDDEVDVFLESSVSEYNVIPLDGQHFREPPRPSDADVEFDFENGQLVGVYKLADRKTKSSRKKKMRSRMATVNKRRRSLFKPDRKHRKFE